MEKGVLILRELNIGQGKLNIYERKLKKNYKLTMETYYITSSVDSESYTKDFASYKEALQWVENTLDLSKNWTITV